MSHDLAKPLLLSPDNFTPLSRTPWAGNTLVTKLKGDLIPPNQRSSLVGESWDISTDDHFPSKVLNIPGNGTLKDLIDEHFRELIASEACTDTEKYDKNFQLLVKTMSTGLPLSLQIHPEDTDSHLLADECGKPESWYIIDRKEGAGIYLGFSELLTPAKLKSHINSHDDIREFLNFVPVEPGDYFEIAPKTVHAIGSGITLLEPQRVLPNKSGKTFRLFDWGRKYDDLGNVSATGKARDLHVEESLRLIDFDHQIGQNFSNSLRRTATIKEIISHEDTKLTWQIFPKNDYYQLHIIEITSSFSGESAAFSLDFGSGFGTGIALNGTIFLKGKNKEEVCVDQGQPFFLPHCGGNFHLKTAPKKSYAKIALIIPNWGSLAIADYRSKK